MVDNPRSHLMLTGPARWKKGKSMSAIRVLAVLWLVGSAPLLAQPKPGDFLVGDLSGKGLFAVDPSTLTVTTLFAGQPGGFVNWVVMDFDNRHMMAVTGNQSNGMLLKVTPQGAITSLATVSLGTSPNGIELDQDGTYLVTGTNSSNLGVFLRITSGGFVGSVLPSTPPLVNNVIIDQDTGDYMLALWSVGQLWRVDRHRLAVTTLAGGMGSVSAVDHEPRTGDLVVTSFNPSMCYVVGRAGGIIRSFTTSHDHAIKVDDETGNYRMAGFNGVGVYSPTGARIQTYGPHPGRWTSIEVYGSRKVAGSGSARAGTTYSLQFSFPRAGPGAAYIGALSLVGHRPGIPIGAGRVVNLAPDNLTALMLRLGDIPGLTSGFQGQLGINGNAVARVHIPPGFPPGIRLFATAVAVSPTAPNGVEGGNTWGFTTQ